MRVRNPRGRVEHLCLISSSICLLVRDLGNYAQRSTQKEYLHATISGENSRTHQAQYAKIKVTNKCAPRWTINSRLVIVFNGSRWQILTEEAMLLPLFTLRYHYLQLRRISWPSALLGPHKLDIRIIAHVAASRRPVPQQALAWVDKLHRAILFTYKSRLPRSHLPSIQHADWYIASSVLPVATFSSVHHVYST